MISKFPEFFHDFEFDKDFNLFILFLIGNHKKTQNPFISRKVSNNDLFFSFKQSQPCLPAYLIHASEREALLGPSWCVFLLLFSLSLAFHKRGSQRRGILENPRKQGKKAEEL